MATRHRRFSSRVRGIPSRAPRGGEHQAAKSCQDRPVSHLMLLDTASSECIISNMRRGASIYVRLSTLAADSNTSLRGMVSECRELCARHGLDLVSEHVDEGLSGGVRDRPQFKAWLDDAVQGRAEVLVSWSVDRLTREGLNVAATILDVVEGKAPGTGKKGNHKPVRLIDTRGIDSASGEGWRMQFVVLAEVARAERERIRDRAHAAKTRLAEQRRYPGGPPPYGYRTAENPDGPGRVLVVDETEAAYIRKAADMVLAGQSVYAATKALNEAGSRPRRANAWAITSLRMVLTGDAVLGRMKHRGELARNESGVPLTVWTPILSLEDVERLRALTEPRRTGGPRRRASRVLSGLVLCGACGSRMRVNSTGKEGSRIARYNCAGPGDGRDCRSPVSIAADLLDDHVVSEFLERYGDFPVCRVQEVQRERQGVLEVSEALRHAATEMTLPGADIEALAERVRVLQQRRTELELEPLIEQTETVYTGLEVSEMWEHPDTDLTRRRELISAALSGVKIGPGRRGRKGLDASRVSPLWRGREDQTLVTPDERFPEFKWQFGEVILRS
ncbi:MAG: hypothetical protein GEU93_11210 [Propionibacteriales bacterium]|nr:hypothetical protein [Propionibacteriales bacterium]